MGDRNTTSRHTNDDDNLTVVTVGTDAPPEELTGRGQLAIHHQQKQGGKYFGCCCDYRRAVFILGATHAFLAMTDLIIYILQIQRDVSFQPNYDDVMMVDELTDIYDDYRRQLMICEAAAIFFGIVSMIGAWKFSRLLTFIAILYAISGTLAIIFVQANTRSNVNSILDNYGLPPEEGPSLYYYVFLGMVLFIWWHPSIFFLWEVHQGIMTPETYVREDSCGW